MLAFRLSKALALWIAVAVAIGHAYMRAAIASTLDARVPWGMPIVFGALLLGALLARLLANRRPERWTQLDADQWGLALLVAALLTDGLSHVPGQTSIRVLLEEIPPLFAPLFPAVALAVPLLLARTRRAVGVPDQFLAAGLALTTLSGGLVLMSGAQALVLALVVLLTQLAAVDGRLTWRAPVLIGGLLVLLLALAAFVGPNELSAVPSLRWTLTLAALGLAVAVRPRERDGWLLVLGAQVALATLVSLCGVALTGYLAREVDLGPALDTRLTLFRQHPNFLGPFFAFHAVLALGLALASRRLRIPGLLATLLLAASTIHTDSKAGTGCLVLGLVATPLVIWLGRRRAAGRLPLPSRRGLLLGAGVLLVLGVGGASLAGERLGAWTAERFERSFEYRVDAWRNSLAIVGEHPWIGIGPHTFVSLTRFAPGSRFFNEPESPHPHNVLLYVAQAAGLPALAVFLAWIALLALRLGRASVRDLGAPPLLAAAVLASLLGLLAANLLDLGMALETVVPAPIFLVAGLLAARRADAPVRERVSPALGLIASLVVLALLVEQGLDPVRAETAFEQGQMHAALASQLGHEERDMAAARDALRESLRLDGDDMRPYEILARWEESSAGGFAAARDVLLQRIERAPRYGPSHALLGRMYMRAGDFAQAYDELALALADGHGSRFLNQDRADAVVCLARQGRRDEALELLADSLRLDVDVIQGVPWTTDPASGDMTLSVANGSQQPLRLVDAIEIAYGHQVMDRNAGRPVGRVDWMSTYLAFRKAGRDDRALALLDDFEANVPVVERHTIATERAWIAEDAGDLRGALALWEKAKELSPNPFYDTHIGRLRGLLGEAVEAQGRGEQAFAESGEILAQPTAFRDNRDSLAANAEADGKPGKAAALLEHTLLYEDDLLERAARLQRIGDLWLDAREWTHALSAYREALVTLAARPYPASMLQVGFSDSRPAQLAHGMVAAWRAQGRDEDGVQDAAWGLPGFFGARAAPSLFRLALFAEIGRMDQLLKEADLQLLDDEDDLLAHWARLLALEGLGRFEELRSEMRSICERVAETRPLERVAQTLIGSIQAQGRLGDPEAWREVGLVTLLRGKYAEAADMFGRARELQTDDPFEAAEIAGWQARALLLSDRPDRRGLSLALLEGALRTRPDDGALRCRVEALR